MSNKRFSLALHGGAGAMPGHDYTDEIEHMRATVLAAKQRLQDGMRAVDVAVFVVAQLEASGLYIAGRGASPNAAGVYELDASIMDGSTGKAGSVAALEGFTSPITAARAVMERSQHVMLVGAGAMLFCASQGLTEIADQTAWFTHAGQFEANHAPNTGTVGCVVRDGRGDLAAATSTAGVFEKLPGRVGDSPLIGAGTWADQHVAVSCTGQGEYFIRQAVGAQVAHRMRFGKESLASATKAAIDGIAQAGGHGGLISVDREGDIALPFASSGMKRAALRLDGSISAEAF